MTDEIIFKVGESYENVKGVYEVISTEPDNDSMVIQWENGDKIETSIKFQAQIIKRLLFEKTINEEKKKSYSFPKSYGAGFNGFVDSDFKNNVTGTTWRSRDSLGGAVSKLLPSETFYFISNAVYRVPMTQWADLHHRVRVDSDASEQAKFYVQTSEKNLQFGFYIEHTAESSSSKKDWNNFIQWLSKEENEKWVNKLSEQNGLTVKIDEWYLEEMISDLLIKPKKEMWEKDNKKIDSIIPFLKELNSEHWMGLYIFSDMKKETVISKNKGIAKDIAEIFELLMPLYKASIEHLKKIPEI